MSKLQKIIYVDDEDDIRSVARLALEKLGNFTVKACSSGEEALGVIKEFSPQLILLDVMMPGMDGPTTMANMRKLDGMKDIPVFFMTAKVNQSEIDEYLALGASCVIRKPFNPMELSSQIEAAWWKCAGN